MELTKPTDLSLKIPLNGDKEEKLDDDEETVSEPATPTTNEDIGLDETSQSNNRKKKRKRSKRGKQQS